MSTHFLHPVHQKATRTKSLEMFYVGEWAWEIIISLVDVLKTNGEVDV
jgi:hypothetical protein